ncbi:MAG: bifunctional diaminohydroxyphosphoribosylaminopyrimidine deaminase/5-amino-6-(5-phosphoribosylamino)uracil reductase RibD [Candidatus Omnitrophica bacterium]|nr:bifunctional diaminohydroxyphosphoribosylaminopyrimidine deaminase/5-amino-6-(5-phosphoribosylamino)uracil reductase RibD [Candidatus Omnitrophota bacterium]
MSECLNLARKAEGKTLPNPMVGSVLVKNNKIISRGYHKKSGSPHAEAEAINNAGRNAKGAILYVNLEPCSSYGKTPPCVDAIIRSGIKKVVVAVKDPNPKHNGRGLKILSRHGIEVKCGVMKEQACELNKVFLKNVTEKMPYVTLKVACSLDGRLADFGGESKWITDHDARMFSHSRIRSNTDAILVGINTVLKDDPLLSVRYGRLKTSNPIKVVLDSSLKVSLNSGILKGPGRTIIVSSEKCSNRAKAKTLANKGVKIIALPSKSGFFNIKDLLKILYSQGIYRLLVEGGGSVISSFIDAKAADYIYIFTANMILGGDYLVYNGRGFRLSKPVKVINREVKIFKNSVLISGDLSYV